MPASFLQLAHIDHNFDSTQQSISMCFFSKKTLQRKKGNTSSSLLLEESFK